MINLRFPPSSAFNCITACAVVALPEKKSRTISFFVLSTIVIKYLIKSTGFAKSKGMDNSCNSFLLCLFSHFVIKSTGTMPSSLRSFNHIFVYIFHSAGSPSELSNTPFDFLKAIFPFSFSSRYLSLLQRQHPSVSFGITIAPSLISSGIVSPGGITKVPSGHSI